MSMLPGLLFLLLLAGGAFPDPPALPAGAPGQRNQVSPAKVALVVAIDAYPPRSGWPVIHSGNDIPLIQSTLLKRGFSPARVTILRDAACTKAGIVSAIRARLIEEANPGDLIYFHYCGHGQQLPDDNQDESDGWDEALVPVDAPAGANQRGYRGEKHLRDDELGKLLTEIRKKVGPTGEVVFTIDACHSGSATREQDPPGGEDALDFAAPLREPRIEPEKSGYLDGKNPLEASPSLAPFVIISSSSYDEVASEIFDENGKLVGPLAYALSQSLAQAAEKMTYRSLFGQIKRIMLAKVPEQTPQIEGDVDRPVLRGRGAE